MEKRKLGNSGIAVAPIAFGGNVFGWTIDEPTSFRLLDAFTGAGFNLVDTADVYSRWAPGNAGGESETIIGNWLKSRGNRDKVIIATKVGSDMGNGKVGLSRRHITEAVDASLKRLRTDYIDLYQTHFDDGSTPIDETLATYADLVKQGKVRAIGASNLSPDRLKASLEISRKQGYPRYETFQPNYNLYDRKDYEKDIEPIVTENGLGVINYYSLASGFLTGKYRSEADLGKSARGQGVKKYLDDRGFRILKALDEVSAKYGVKPAAVAIAWLQARPSITAPIASATNETQLEVLLSAAKLQLDGESVALLDEASAWK